MFNRGATLLVSKTRATYFAISGEPGEIYLPNGVLLSAQRCQPRHSVKSRITQVPAASKPDTQMQYFIANISK